MNDSTTAEKLVRLESATGRTTYIRPSAVQAIEPCFLGGCEVHLAATDGRKANKVFVNLDPDEIAAKLNVA
ncbi:hypothetical protein ACEN2Y_00455 (plasmid) [Ralstonia solanacearum]|uniref:hypothetical protein n=1 Tax=Ralstonia solanacearum TaxID=305 RepID=UPI0018D0F4F0|nr:hypothetical protein [Ralstonia solanacearum]